MIIDPTGVEPTPGNLAKDCLGNGRHKGIECCCDECNYMLCCMTENYQQRCADCSEFECPRKDVAIYSQAT